MGCCQSSAVQPEVSIYNVPSIRPFKHSGVNSSEDQDEEFMYSRAAPDVACRQQLKRLKDEPLQFRQLHMDQALASPLASHDTALDQVIAPLLQNFHPKGLGLRQMFLAAEENKTEDIETFKKTSGLRTEQREAETGDLSLSVQQHTNRMMLNEVVCAVMWASISNNEVTRQVLTQEMDALAVKFTGLKVDTSNTNTSFFYSFVAFLQLFMQHTDATQNGDPPLEIDGFSTVIPSSFYNTATLRTVQAYYIWRTLRFQQLGYSKVQDFPVSATYTGEVHQNEEKLRDLTRAYYEQFYTFIQYDKMWLEANKDKAEYRHGVTNVEYYRGKGGNLSSAQTNESEPAPIDDEQNPCVKPKVLEVERWAGQECTTNTVQLWANAMLTRDFSGVFLMLPEWVRSIWPQNEVELYLSGLGTVERIEHKSIDMAYLGGDLVVDYQKLAETDAVPEVPTGVLDYSVHGNTVQVNRKCVANVLILTCSHNFILTKYTMTVYTDKTGTTIGMSFPVPFSVVAYPMPATHVVDKLVNTFKTGIVIPRPVQGTGHCFALVANVPSIGMKTLRLTYHAPKGEACIVGMCLPPFIAGQDINEVSISTSNGLTAMSYPDTHIHAAGGSGAQLAYVSGGGHAQIVISYTVLQLQLVHGDKPTLEAMGGAYYDVRTDISRTMIPRFIDEFDMLATINGQRTAEFEAFMKKIKVDKFPDLHQQLGDNYLEICKRWSSIPAQNVLAAAFGVYKTCTDQFYINPYAPELKHVGMVVSGAAARQTSQGDVLVKDIHNHLPVSCNDLLMVYVAATRSLNIPTRIVRGFGASYCQILAPGVGWVSVDPTLLNPHSFGQIYDTLPTPIYGCYPMVDIAYLLSYTNAGQVALRQIADTSKVFVSMCLLLGGCKSAWSDLTSESYRQRLNNDYNHRANALCVVEKMLEKNNQRYDCTNQAIRVHPAGSKVVVRSKNIFDSSVLEFHIEWKEHRIISLFVQYMSEQEAQANSVFNSGSGNIESQHHTMKKYGGQKNLDLVSTGAAEMGLYMGPTDAAFSVPEWNQQLQIMHNWRTSGSEMLMKYNWISSDNDVSVSTGTINSRVKPAKHVAPQVLKNALVCIKVVNSEEEDEIADGTDDIPVTSTYDKDTTYTVSKQYMEDMPRPDMCGTGVWTMEEIHEHSRSKAPALMPNYYLWDHIPQPKV